MKDMAWWLFGAFSGSVLGMVSQSSSDSPPIFYYLLGQAIATTLTLLGIAIYAAGRRSATRQASMDMETDRG